MAAYIRSIFGVDKVGTHARSGGGALAGWRASVRAGRHVLRRLFRRDRPVREGDPARCRGGHRGHPVPHGRQLRAHARGGHDVRH